MFAYLEECVQSMVACGVLLQQLLKVESRSFLLVLPKPDTHKTYIWRERERALF